VTDLITSAESRQGRTTDSDTAAVSQRPGKPAPWPFTRKAQLVLPASLARPAASQRPAGVGLSSGTRLVGKSEPRTERVFERSKRPALPLTSLRCVRGSDKHAMRPCPTAWSLRPWALLDALFLSCVIGRLIHVMRLGSLGRRPGGRGPCDCPAGKWHQQEGTAGLAGHEGQSIDGNKPVTNGQGLSIGRPIFSHASGKGCHCLRGPLRRLHLRGTTFWTGQVRHGQATCHAVIVPHFPGGNSFTDFC
jgi:hypothetical protein